MTARERILALRLLEKQEANNDYANRVGVCVTVIRKPHRETLEQKEI